MAITEKNNAGVKKKPQNASVLFHGLEMLNTYLNLGSYLLNAHKTFEKHTSHFRFKHKGLNQFLSLSLIYKHRCYQRLVAGVLDSP